MKLIDVTTRLIVDASPAFKYAALSYVWGYGPAPTVAIDQLPDQLPRTIEDNMEATAQLGIKHLWVDRYCIRQDYKQEKLLQIH